VVDDSLSRLEKLPNEVSLDGISVPLVAQLQKQRLLLSV
jgi:hypothetical protein